MAYAVAATPGPSVGLSTAAWGSGVDGTQATQRARRSRHKDRAKQRHMGERNSPGRVGSLKSASVPVSDSVPDALRSPSSGQPFSDALHDQYSTGAGDGASVGASEGVDQGRTTPARFSETIEVTGTEEFANIFEDSSAVDEFGATVSANWSANGFDDEEEDESYLSTIRMAAIEEKLLLLLNGLDHRLKTLDHVRFLAEQHKIMEFAEEQRVRQETQEQEKAKILAARSDEEKRNEQQQREMKRWSVVASRLIDKQKQLEYTFSGVLIWLKKN